MRPHKLFLLAVAAVTLLGAESKKVISIPVERTEFSAPVTPTQKRVHDFHLKEAGRRLQGDSIKMTNSGNVAYTGPVYFGTPLQTTVAQSGFVYDTGSGWLVTTSTDCSACTTQHYNPGASTSMKTVSTEPKTLRYGSADLEGYIDSDTVCLSSSGSACASDFEFVVITQEDGLNGLDGILGMSPANESQNGPSYMKALVMQGVIDEPVATFWLNDLRTD